MLFSCCCWSPGSAACRCCAPLLSHAVTFTPLPAQSARHTKERAKKNAAQELWRAQYNKEERKKRYVEEGNEAKRAAKRSKGS